MNETTVAALQKDEKFEGFLLVRTAEQRMSNAGKGYLDMTLGDRSGNISAKMWDGTVTPPPAGSVVKVRATGNEFLGRIQLRVEKIRVAEPDDIIDLALLVPSAPHEPEQMMAEVTETIDGMTDDNLAKLTRALIERAGEKLLLFPAAKQMHHAHRGGLLYHVTTMLKAAKALLGVYDYLNADLLLAGVIIHDLGKLTEMEADDLGGVTDYTTDGKLIGHIVRGVVDIQLAGDAAGVDAATIQIMQHMVLSHHGIPDFGSPVAPKFPEAEVLHTLDTLDARLYEMNEALARALQGGFSDKVWGLDNRQLYRIPGSKVCGEDAPTEP